jgi:Flp pilus assembly pilin Flp
MLDDVTAYVTALSQNASYRVRERLREESGQTAAEYIGVIVLIAAILAAIAASGIGGKLTELIEDAINKVSESQD